MEGGSIGSNSRLLNSECREAVTKLLKKCGLDNRMPAVFACGGRANAYRDFEKELRNKKPRFDNVFLWIDSEDLVANIDATWQHLVTRDGWARPKSATDEQVLLMTTSMETFIAADRAALRAHYGTCLREKILPPLEHLEQRPRAEVLDRLERATDACPNKYKKGKRSFEVLAKLNPDALEELPSFRRARRILKSRL
jgi:hypothetical protein